VELIDLGEAEPIDRMIADFRTAITCTTEDEAGRDLGALPGKAEVIPDIHVGLALRAAVFDPLIAGLAQSARLLLSPDGDLTRLPFGVLPWPAGKRLVDSYEIGYVAAGRDVLRFAIRSSAPQAEPVILADPDFDLLSSTPVSRTSEIKTGRQSRDLDLRHSRFVRLPGTRVEGERVAELLGVRPWLADEALEGRLKACRSPWIVHLATHGFFLGDQFRPENGLRGPLSGPDVRDEVFDRLAQLENPLLRSGLALAGANSWLDQTTPPPEAEDGLLTAEDVT
jgi:hypothetical protein